MRAARSGYLEMVAAVVRQALNDFGVARTAPDHRAKPEQIDGRQAEKNPNVIESISRC